MHQEFVGLNWTQKFITNAGGKHESYTFCDRSVALIFSEVSAISMLQQRYFFE